MNSPRIIITPIGIVGPTEHEVGVAVSMKTDAKVECLTDTFSQKVERAETVQIPEEVIVFTLENIDNECPGMLPEDKVRLRFAIDITRDQLTLNLCLGITRKWTNEAIENSQQQWLRSVGHGETPAFSLEW